MRLWWEGGFAVALAAIGCGGKVNGPAHAIDDGGAGGHPGVQGADGAGAITGDDPGGADGSFPFNATCGNGNCGYLQIEDFTASSCCGDNDRCGAALVPADQLGPVAAGCIEFQQRGKPDPTCPAAMLANALGVFTLSGCCRASGTCGVSAADIEQLPSFGCVDRAAWGLDSAGACAANRTCNDGIEDFGETDRDCGGPDCPACGDAEDCAADRDCVTGYCSARGCAVPVCNDAVRNGSESDVDCGTGCVPCPTGSRCRIDADCLSNSCAGTVCQ